MYLQEDEERPSYPGEIKLIYNVNITLNLNGHTITHADIGYTDYYTVSIIDMWAGTLTITGGGTIHGMYNTAAVTVSGGTLTIDDGVTVKGEFAYGEKEFNGKPKTDKTRAIAVKGGTLTVNGGSFEAASGVALEYTKGTVRLYGGSFNGMNIVTRDYSSAINEGVTVVDFLAPGRTYQHTDGTALTDEEYYVQNIPDVKVVKGLTPVPYVNENGAAATAREYTQIEADTTVWNDGLYPRQSIPSLSTLMTSRTSARNTGPALRWVSPRMAAAAPTKTEKNTASTSSPTPRSWSNWPLSIPLCST